MTISRCKIHGEHLSRNIYESVAGNETDAEERGRNNGRERAARLEWLLLREVALESLVVMVMDLEEEGWVLGAMATDAEDGDDGVCVLVVVGGMSLSSLAL